MPITYNDADLLLRIYELRREPKLRAARDFMNKKCSFRDYDEYKKKYPMGSPAGQAWGMVIGYWDMVCALVDRGALDKDLFNICTSEHVFLYLKYRQVIEGGRREANFPEMFASLERVATSHPHFAHLEKWVAMEAAKSKPAGKASAPAKKKLAARG